MGRNASGRDNRVAPDSSFHAVASRGRFWGNRGQLLDVRGERVRPAQALAWIICELEFRGRTRVQWQPGRLTELYFLDEPTALAAGHRPCGECRHPAFRSFAQAWAAAHHEARVPRAAEMDRVLQADRLDGRVHRTYRADLAGLPDGVIVEHADECWLVHGDRLLAWGFDGYTGQRDRSGFPARVSVHTPYATVLTLRAGYRPVVHPSAEGTG